MSNDIDLQPLLDLRQNQLGLVFSNGDGIDGKALAIMASNIAILIFIAQSKFTFAWWGWLLILVPYVISLGFNIFAIWPRKYVGASVSVVDHPEYLGLEPQELVLQLISDTEYAITTNEQINTIRRRACDASIILFLIGLVPLATALIFATIKS